MNKIIYTLVVFSCLISGLNAANFTFKIKNSAGYIGHSYRFSNLQFSYFSSEDPRLRIKTIQNLGINSKWLENWSPDKNTKVIVLDDVDASEEVSIICNLVNVQERTLYKWLPDSGDHKNGYLKALWGKGKGFKKITNGDVLQLKHIPEYSDFEHKEFRIKIGDWLSK